MNEIIEMIVVGAKFGIAGATAIIVAIAGFIVTCYVVMGALVVLRVLLSAMVNALKRSGGHGND